MADFRGLDISNWQEGMDVAQWKNALGLTFIIIKVGGNEGGRYRDRCFDGFYKQAKACGLHIGAYYYTTSTTTDAAYGDAEHCLSLLEGYDLDMPVYMDVEDSRQFALSARALTDVIKTFCDRVNAGGRYAGLYTGGSAWLNSMYKDELTCYANWIAWWADWGSVEGLRKKCGDIGMWQVGGISLSGDVAYGDVAGHEDYDLCDIKYWERIKNGENSTPSTPEPTPSPEPSKGGTVEDVMREAYADLGYYAPADPERGSKAGRYCAALMGEDWLAGPSTEIWWCCMWVSMILDKAGVYCPGFPTQNTDIALNGGARSRCVDASDIRRGDIIIYDWNWDGATDHIGFATSSISGGKFSTIEGNVGNAVKECSRDLGNVAYVIRPDYAGGGDKTTPDPIDTKPKNNRDGGKLDVDGVAGWNTIIDLQHTLGTPEDGEISGQWRGNAAYHNAVAAVRYDSGDGSLMVEALQRMLNAGVDGQWGPDTSTKFQKFLIKRGYDCGVCGADGYFGSDSVKALQRWLNDGAPR